MPYLRKLHIINKLLTTLLLLILFTTTLHAEHDHDAHEDGDFEFTEYEAHEHGRAITEISYGDNQLNVHIIIPAINVLGFEHTPNTQEEKNIADAILAKLVTPENVLEINTDCTVATAHIEQNHEDDHDKHHEHEHYNIEIEHEYDCQSNDKIMLSFSIFKTLPTLEKLDVQYVSEQQQNLITLTPDNIIFTAH